MALDIGELLGSYGQGMRALLAAAGLPESMMGDAATGGTPAPAAPAAASAPAPAAVDPRLAFVQHAQKGPRSLLEALAARRQPKLQGSVIPRTPVRLLTDAAGHGPLEQTIRVNQGAGPRAGQAFQAFDLGGGRRAHVYVDARGKRQVVVVRR